MWHLLGSCCQLGVLPDHQLLVPGLGLVLKQMLGQTLMVMLPADHRLLVLVRVLVVVDRWSLALMLARVWLQVQQQLGVPWCVHLRRAQQQQGGRQELVEA